nr:enoyl-CoA hydratase-related protein [Coxiella burnetii]
MWLGVLVSNDIYLNRFYNNKHHINDKNTVDSLADSASQTILQGQIGVFCTGMDFTNLQPPKSRQSSDNTLLHRFVTFSRIIISCVEGAVIAGGMGLVASSDLVVATSQSQFSLSEAIWGLLPVCVTPYLIRRVGFQAAYRLGFTTETIDAKEAYRLQLIDLLSDEPLKKFTPMSCALAVLIYARLKD